MESQGHSWIRQLVCQACQLLALSCQGCAEASQLALWIIYYIRTMHGFVVAVKSRGFSSRLTDGLIAYPVVSLATLAGFVHVAPFQYACVLVYMF